MLLEHQQPAVLHELVDIVPGQPLRRTDRGRFLRALGLSVPAEEVEALASVGNALASTAKATNSATAASARADAAESTGDDASAAVSDRAAILLSVGQAAFEMPLPPRWTEQVDVRGLVYFANATRTGSTWEHPLFPAFRETLGFAASLLDRGCGLREAAEGVQEHLAEVQSRATDQLLSWTGPHLTEGSLDEFFHDEATGHSSWENPVEVWQYELHARYWLLVQLLQQLDPLLGGCAAGGEGALEAAAPASTGLTPRFGECPSPLSVGSPSYMSPGYARIRAALGDEVAGALESTLTHSCLSPAVRSHATDIASSLASSILSIRLDPRPPRPVTATPPPPRATKGELPVAPAQKPRPPRPAPHLRHLAAPPRANDAFAAEALLQAVAAPPSGNVAGLPPGVPPPPSAPPVTAGGSTHHGEAKVLPARALRASTWPAAPQPSAQGAAGASLCVEVVESPGHTSALRVPLGRSAGVREEALPLVASPLGSRSPVPASPAAAAAAAFAATGPMSAWAEDGSAPKGEKRHSKRSSSCLVA